METLKGSSSTESEQMLTVTKDQSLGHQAQKVYITEHIRVTTASIFFFFPRNNSAHMSNYSAGSFLFQQWLNVTNVTKNEVTNLIRDVISSVD